MFMTIVMIVFYIVLLGTSAAVGIWLQNNERNYKAS
jgi:hypothetical protein